MGTATRTKSTKLKRSNHANVVQREVGRLKCNRFLALFLVLGMLFSQGAACQHQNEGDPRLPEYNKELPNVPPDPKNPVENGTVRTVVITANVEDAYAPYRVAGSAQDSVTGEIQEFSEPVAGGPFTKILAYQAGHSVTLTVYLSAARSGSPNGYLIIKDGQSNKEVKKMEGAALINITGFKTKR